MQAQFREQLLAERGGLGGRVKDVGADHHDVFRASASGRLPTEEESQAGQLAEHRNSRTNIGDSFFNQSADRDGHAIFGDHRAADRAPADGIDLLSLESGRLIGDAARDR